MKILKKNKKFKFSEQHGQTAVFFALLLPVLILFLFVVFDLGWLYFNKSRLQNAAEAAAIAGANKFCTESSNDYNSVLLIYENDYDDDYRKNIRKDNEDNSHLLNYDSHKNAVNSASTNSWKSNLYGSADAVEDSWTKAEVNMLNSNFYGESTDADKIYYEIELAENVQHIFKVLDILPFTNIPAVAVAEITKGGSDISQRNLFADMMQLDETKTQGNWEEVNNAYTKRGSFNTLLSVKPSAPSTEKPSSSNIYYYSDNSSTDKEKYYYSHAEKRYRLYYEGNWNRSFRPKEQIYYNSGDSWRTEPVIVDKNKLTKTPANGNALFSEADLDAINADFLRDVEFSQAFTSWNWDINQPLNEDITVKSINPEGSPLNLRIHAAVKIDSNFATRINELERLKKTYKKDFSITEENVTKIVSKSTNADPLYIQIEREPIVSTLGFKDMIQLNSVRQIIININESNMVSGDDSEKHSYINRPLVIFYNGPEYNVEADDYNAAEKTSDVRKSQPVILNLNADFRGILFAPYSPVIIVGNNHKFEGFVVAKSFQKLKTNDDFRSESGLTEFTTSDGSKLYAKYSDTKDISQVPLSSINDINEDVLILRTADDRIVKVNRKNGDSDNLIYLSDTPDNCAGTFNQSSLNSDLELENLKTSDIIDADLYNTTDYGESRDIYGVKSDPKTGIERAQAYILKTDMQYIGGTISEGLSMWTIYLDRDPSKPYTLQARKSTANYDGYNILSEAKDWKIFYDGNNKRYIMNISDRLKVIDAEGKVAYVDKRKVTNGNIPYISVKNGDETRFVEIGGDNQYFVERALDTGNSTKDEKGTNPTLIVDQYGNVQCKDFAATTTYDECPYDDKKGFKPSDFGLDNFNSYYSRVGAIPKRREYQALDSWEKDGEKYQDMFFTTIRATETF